MADSLNGEGSRRLFGNVHGKDMVIFIMSLLLASGIWLLHNLSQRYSQIVRVPVSAVCNIEGHSPNSANTAVVQARCRTTGFQILRLNHTATEKSVKVEFNPSDMHFKSEDTYYITANELGAYVSSIFGSESSLEGFVTDTLVFRFPKENSRKVPVMPVYNLSFSPQFTSTSDLRVIPDSVTVYGEPYLIDNLSRVSTESFSLEDLRHSVSGDVRLEKIKGVRFSQEKVDYSLDVARFVEIRATLPVLGRNVPADRMLIIYPSQATVSFRCAFPVTIDPEETTRLYIDYNDFINSLSGKCIASIQGVPSEVFGYKIEPEIFECVESMR
ncbi:MAG: hypothetical protein IKS22_04550 [Bacteroidales bacterium]|nr:hypothetical protein [Bacteroidales bacterium]